MEMLANLVVTVPTVEMEDPWVATVEEVVGEE